MPRSTCTAWRARTRRSHTHTSTTDFTPPGSCASHSHPARHLRAPRVSSVLAPDRRPAPACRRPAHGPPTSRLDSLRLLPGRGGGSSAKRWTPLPRKPRPERYLGRRRGGGPFGSLGEQPETNGWRSNKRSPDRPSRRTPAPCFSCGCGRARAVPARSVSARHRGAGTGAPSRCASDAAAGMKLNIPEREDAHRRVLAVLARLSATQLR